MNLSCAEQTESTRCTEEVPTGEKVYNPGTMKRNLRIASPCTADWDGMAGDERARYCPQCQRDVYNFSALSTAEVERIVREREGRLCARFYQRADGTMLTNDCPAKVRAVLQRVSRLTSAALVAVMSASPAMAAPRSFAREPAWLQMQPTKTGAILEVRDVAGGRVRDAGVTLVDEKTGKTIEARTDGTGQLGWADLPRGSYDVTITATGFRTVTQSHVALPAGEPLRFQIQVAVMGEVLQIENPLPTENMATGGLPDHRNMLRKFLSGLRRIF